MFALIVLLALAVLLFPLIILAAAISKIFQLLFIQKTVKNITGEIAVVTGGAHGLGREICKQLAEKGCHVAVVDINLKGAEETVQILKDQSNKVNAKAYKVDISSYEQVIELRQQITEDMGDATILVNNAGILLLSNPKEPNWREMQAMINVNLTAHFWTLDVFLPKMKELKRGHIVAISSITSFIPMIYNAQYTATKFAVRGLMKVLRLDLLATKTKDVHATTVFPYFLNTNNNVATIYQRTAYNRLAPLISGDNAAKKIVDGMLRNELEIILPSIAALLYRLLECLPASWQDLFLVNLFSRFYPDLFMNLN